MIPRPIEDCTPKCKKCGQAFETQKEVCKHARHAHPLNKHPTKFLFKGKVIDAKIPVRMGVCSKCGAVGYTQLHHDDYDPLNPLAGTRELCAKCHGYETKKQMGYA